MSSQFMSHINIGFDTPANRRQINHSGRIPRLNLEIATGVLFGVASITVILRTIRRLVLFRRLQLDDAFVWFGLICLTAATAIFVQNMSIIMLQEAIAMVPGIIVPITDVDQLIKSISFLDAFLCTIWTCTFAVKASFLALFWGLIKGISKNLDRYYWFVVVYTFVAWAFLVSEAFVLCPYFGAEGAKCYPEFIYKKTVALTVLITVIDIASDIMIASIPILLLRKSRMKTKQKVSLCLFLCLSFVMAILALIRVAGMKRDGIIDNTWSLFWQYTEGCVACIMASITPFRTIFVNIGSQPSRKKTSKGPSSSLRALWKKPPKHSEDSDWNELHNNDALPKPPGALMSGLRTFIRRNNREAGESTVFVTNTFGIDETVSDDPGRDYQRYLRNAAGLPNIAESERGESRGQKQNSGEIV